jgi:hypothetical protein
MKKPKKVPDFLRDAAAIYEQRNALYGDNYKRFGLVMVALFPHGMNLESSLKAPLQEMQDENGAA